MWLLPVRRRVGRLQEFLDEMVATGLSTPGLVLVEENELSELIEDYGDIELPPDWRIVGVPAEGLSAKVQYAYSHGLCGDAKFIGVLADDMHPITHGWDRRLIAGLEGWNIVTGDDLDQAPKRMESATVFSRDLIDAIGYIAPPGLQHLYFDDVWERLNIATGCIRWDMSVKVAHRPKTYAPNPDSTAQAARDFHDADERRFRDWVHDEFPAACEAVIKCAEAHGVKVVRPDLKGVSLYIGTPSGAGQYDRRYVRALMQTVEMIRAAGGEVDWGEMPYCADLSHARARILGAFLRSRHTHWLMIDDDMGWSPHDVLRLLQTKLDLVGGAGPKKMYPLRFCIHSRDEFGREVYGAYHENTDTLEVTGIGTGFLMASRSCIERMVAAYPELIFDPGEGQTEHALFDPIIVNKTRYSDDFAFCYRWRKIGGAVHVLPGVKLAHVGAHCFEGSLLDAMAAEPERNIRVAEAAE
jgi:hypothetical protein